MIYIQKHLIEKMYAKKQMEHEIATPLCSYIVFNQSNFIKALEPLPWLIFFNMVIDLCTCTLTCTYVR